MKITKTKVKAKKRRIAKGWKIEMAPGIESMIADEAMLTENMIALKDVIRSRIETNTYEDIAHFDIPRKRGIVIPFDSIQELVDNPPKDDYAVLVLQKPKGFSFRNGEIFWVQEKWTHGYCPNDMAGIAAVHDFTNNHKYSFSRSHKDSPPESIHWCRYWTQKPAHRMPEWASRFSLKVYDSGTCTISNKHVIWALVKLA